MRRMRSANRWPSNTAVVKKHSDNRYIVFEKRTGKLYELQRVGAERNDAATDEWFWTELESRKGPTII